MNSAIKLGKIVALFILAVVVLSFFSFSALLAYQLVFEPDTTYSAKAFPFEKTDLDNDAVIINLSKSDFEQYPVLNQLVNTPEGGSFTFNHFEWDYERVEEFRNQYRPVIEISNSGETKFISRYFFWNGTYYQIPVTA